MNYDFSITNSIKDGFKHSNGIKGLFIASLIIYILITLFIKSILEFIFPHTDTLINEFIIKFLIGIFITPIHVGIIMLSVSNARGKEIKVLDMFKYLNTAMPIVITYISLNIFIYFGFLFFILPGIYLSISYIFTYILVVDKGLKTWDAMELSRKTISTHWFKFFSLTMLTSIILLISIIPFGIGLIWSLPTVYTTYSLLYIKLFDDL